MTATFTIATPIWRPELTEAEIVRVSLTSQAMSDHERVFVHPEGMNTAAITQRFPEWTTRAFSGRHFASVASYSTWLMSEEPYNAFAYNDFLGICQLDAVILRAIPDWVAATDYTGAPWDPAWRLIVFRDRLRLLRIAGRQIGRRLVIGNGGLSFRRTSAFAQAAGILANMAPAQVIAESHEDAIWSYYASRLGVGLADEGLAARDFVDLRADGPVDFDRYVGVHGLKNEFVMAHDSLLQWTDRSSG